MKHKLFLFLISPIPIVGALYLVHSNKRRITPLLIRAQRTLIELESSLFGGKSLRLFRFLLSWTVPTIYFSLFAGLVTFFYTEVYHKLENPYTLLYNALLLLLFSSFVLAVYTEPVRATGSRSAPITPTTPSWPHDGIIFFSADCKTCHLTKPARSKHCKYCGGCVFLYDHHCVWLNNCIGLGNIAWFYAFLMMNCLVLSYAALLALPLAWRNLKIEGVDASPELGLGLFCALCDLLVIWFATMIALDVRAGMTTNEHMKWQIIHDLVKEGNLYETDGVDFFEYLPAENVFVSAYQEDSRVLDLERYRLNKVENVKELVNVYDRGSFWDNLKERLVCTRFPGAL